MWRLTSATAEALRGSARHLWRRKCGWSQGPPQQIVVLEEAISRILYPLESGGRSFLWPDRHRPARAAYPGVLRRAEPAVGTVDSPIWPCSARGLPCPDRRRSSGGLLPHHFTLTRPKPGGIFSVALSLALPRLGVTQRAPTRSSDFPRSAYADRERLPPPAPHGKCSARRAHPPPGCAGLPYFRSFLRWGA